MCQLIESVKIKNRKLYNIRLHNYRLNNARKELFGLSENLLLENIINIPQNLDNGVYKARIVYSKEIEAIEFIPYKAREINSIQIIESNTINYKFKYLDRTALDNLRQNSSADEIIIIKNGFVTDTSYSNLAFHDGTNWFTPLTYLLNGTMRQLLLSEGKISGKEIKKEDIKHYKHVKLINAMMDFEESPLIAIDRLIFL
jgi:Branched-chain amino acid aminotransferase/4-amino-4-deoxychorismate lyase